ncbi:hypothetical protein E3T23_01810 [Cryobacterium cheniae]|uniref:Uncharacterized protein n=1 Tax=Cryobacterium cheniae TaxID=1259262 RepID=A0A4R8Y014_9MICO|nr:hypothetical protein [Cryobacterium cheniae]TFC83721.1 hypothetical protein E3T23_01810 [Cryobacterium cheniae]
MSMVDRADRNSIAEYVTKQHLLRRSPEAKTRYPGDLLADAATGDIDATALWNEYTKAAMNRAILRAYGDAGRRASEL